jgi:hypothetical protein
LRNVIRAPAHDPLVAALMRVPRHVARLAAFVASGALGLAQAAPAADYSEDAVKAAFLHRFAAYVEWPAAAETDAEFVIAVAGADGVHEELERLLPKVTVQGRPAHAVVATRPEHVANARILFVGRQGAARRPALLAAAARRHVLVVTEAEDGLEAGGAINFVRDGRRVRFEISLAAAERNGLKIKSDLLSVATRVTESRTEGTRR